VLNISYEFRFLGQAQEVRRREFLSPATDEPKLAAGISLQRNRRISTDSPRPSPSVRGLPSWRATQYSGGESDQVRVMAWTVAAPACLMLKHPPRLRCFSQDKVLAAIVSVGGLPGWGNCVS
jgi:hypothetical protein